MTLMLLIAAGALPAVALDQPRPNSPNAKCPRTTSYHAFDRSRRVDPKNLNQLPPANAYAAVYRQVGGCEVPVVVRYNVGGR